MLQSWPDVFVSASQNLVQGFFEFIPGFLGAIIIFAVGWVLAVMVSRAIEHILNLIKIDSLFKEIGTERVLERMGFKLRVGRFIGEVVRWFIVIAFLIPSLEVLGLSSINDFLRNDVLGYLPNIFVAALVLIIASYISDALHKFIEGSARAVNSRAARMSATISRWAIWVFAVIIALSELGIAEQFMSALFIGIVAMLSLAGGLAFGLGGKEAAAKAINKMSDSLKD
ncbi:hypothetical protein KBD68_04095 [Candidatus Woesebacteria bacterium]|nr:hypothetical protein [Candidatus Woesebacteria bacterium]